MKKLKLGIEIECVSTLDRYSMKDALIEVFGPKYKVVMGGYDIDVYENDTIYLCIDCSIEETPRPKYIGRRTEVHGHEIVTPPMSEGDCRKFMRKFYKHFVYTNKCWMNKSCGMHVNVSFMDAEANKKLKAEMLYVYFETYIWMYTFGRTRNCYCELNVKKADLRSIAKRMNNQTTNKGWFILNELGARIDRRDWNKYNAINICNWNKGFGRIEFRIAGGVDVMNLDLMEMYIGEIKGAMNKSIAPLKGASVVARFKRIAA